MPQIPIYQQRTVVSGSLNLATAPADDGRGLAMLGQAFEHMANVGLDLEQRDAALEASSTLSSMRMKAGALFQEHQRNATDSAAGFTPALVTAFDEQLKATLETTKHRRAKPLIEERAREIRERLHQAGIEFEANTSETFRDHQFKDVEQNLALSIDADPDSWDAAIGEQLIAIDAMQLPPAERLKRRASLYGAATAAAAQGFAQRNPDLTLVRLADKKDALFSTLRPEQRIAVQQIARERIASDYTNGIMAQYEQNVFAGNKALAGVEAYDVDEEMKFEIRKQVGGRVAQLNAVRQAEYVQNIADMNVDIADGDPAENAERVALGLYAQGALTEEKYSTALAGIARARIERAKAAVDLQAGLQAIANKTPLDPKDEKARKSIDAAFAHITKGVPRGTAEYQNAAIDVARTTSVAPASAVSWARTALTAGDPDGAAAAAWFVHKLEEANPRAFRYVEDDKMKAAAELISSSMAAGAPPAQAVETARKNVFELPDARRKYLEEVYDRGGASIAAKPVRMAELNTQELKRRLDTDNERFDKRLLHGAPAAPVALAADYNEGVRRYFLSTNGDLDAARNLAWRDLRRKGWGYSEVNGKPELMPYAPEVMFPQLPAGVIRQDMIDTAIPDPASEAGKRAAESLRLVPSPETADSGGVRWFIGTKGEYGEYEIVRDPTGQPRAYDLPVSNAALAEINAREKVKAAKAAEDFVRKQRQMNDFLIERIEKGGPEADDARRMLWFAPKVAEGVKVDAAAKEVKGDAVGER